MDNAGAAGGFAQWPEQTSDDREWMPFPDEAAGWVTSQKLIYAMLHELGETTATELMEEGHMSPGTVYPALKELDEKGVVEWRYRMVECREKVWRLTDDSA